MVAQEFDECDQNRYHKTGQQDHKNATDVVHPECVRLALLIFVFTNAGGRILPPLIVQQLNDSLLLEIEYHQRDLVSPRRTCSGRFEALPAAIVLVGPEVHFEDSTFWRANSVSLAVQEPANLHEVTVPLHHVIQHRRLH